jgi:outer membrane protein TolC
MEFFKNSSNCLIIFARKKAIRMKRFSLWMFLSCLWLPTFAQIESKTLSYYQEAAQKNSPLLTDLRNQSTMNADELRRLQAMYTRSHAEMTGYCLFVPIISKDNQKTQFELFKQDGTDYYGYDLGQANSQMQATVTWTQPLLGKPFYKEMERNASLQDDILRNNISLEKHQLERTVREQYLLCLLDQQEKTFTDTISALLEREQKLLKALQFRGLARQTDVQLIHIQQTGDEELRRQVLQSFRSHLADLNTLCGVGDTGLVRLEGCKTLQSPSSFSFEEKYRLDSLDVKQKMSIYNLQYRPQLDFFIDGGMRTALDKNLYRHFGWSIGLSFRLPIYDGGQRKWRQHQMTTQMETIHAYQEYFERQKAQRLAQYSQLIEGYRQRQMILEQQMKEYDNLLKTYQQEIAAGQMSVVDFVTVLQNKIQTEKNCMLLKTNKELAETALDYWK